MMNKTVLGLTESRAAIDAMVAHTQGEASRPVAMAVVDDNGDLIAYAKMDGTSHTAKDMAVRKAYTSARMARDSGGWGDLVRKLGVASAEFGDPKLVGFQGGICVKVADTIVGAIGVSGRSAEEDEAIARVGLAAMGL